MPLYTWSRTSSSNATADPTVYYAEGQAPSSLNDSARAAMAAIAMNRDDIAGAIVTGGSSTAYTVASYSVFDTLAHLNGQMIAFTPHTTNGATVTLSVDGLGAKPLRTSPNVELLAGTIIQGTPYVAVYNSSDAAFYLRGFFGNPYNVPLGAGMDYWLPTAPNSSFVFPIGQAISRTTYATLFAAMGTTFGVGDGSTTFNLPNKTGRVSAMQEGTATLLTSSYFGGNSTVLGAIGGNEKHTLILGELPIGIQSGNAAFSVSSSSTAAALVSDSSVNVAGGGNNIPVPGAFATIASNANVTAGAVVSTSSNTAGNPHVIVQPTIICNYIIRII